MYQPPFSFIRNLHGCRWKDAVFKGKKTRKPVNNNKCEVLNGHISGITAAVRNFNYLRDFLFQAKRG